MAPSDCKALRRRGQFRSTTLPKSIRDTSHHIRMLLGLDVVLVLRTPTLQQHRRTLNSRASGSYNVYGSSFHLATVENAELLTRCFLAASGRYLSCTYVYATASGRERGAYTRSGMLLLIRPITILNNLVAIKNTASRRLPADLLG